MHRKRVCISLTGAILLVYLLILHRYGTAIPATMPPEEINFAGLARSIAEGKGPVFTIPSEIVPSPAENPRKFFMPVLSYAFALSGWGSIWGFDLLALRWFNRILGALDLLLLILVARRWGVPRGLALLAAFWTSMDIVYQLVSNMVRSDMLSLFGVLLGLWAFTNGRERGGGRWWLASGLCFAIALFAHFWQAFFIVAWLALHLLLRRQLRDLTAFLVPLIMTCSLWFLFVLQDWEWFRFLSRLMVQDKTPMSWVAFVFRLLGIQTFQSVLGIYPSNSPIWIAVLTTLTWAGLRRQLTVPLWQWGMFWVAYTIAYINPHPWYAGWFAPFGYLALVLLGDQLLRSSPKSWTVRVLAVLILVWSGYQAVQVGRCWQAAPSIHRAHQVFFRDLIEDLPQGRSFWLRSVPDPSFSLRQSRPDLILYVGSGYLPYPAFFPQLDGIIAVPGWLPLPELPPHRIRRKWLLPGVLTGYHVLWVEPLPSD